MILEIMATSLKDVKEIAHTKVDRIQYCTDVEQGGLTPKIDEVKRVLKVKNHQPINVVIRPTSHHFAYSFLQYIKMVQAVKKFSKTEINGFVFGILKYKDNSINVWKTKHLTKIAKKYNKQVIFNRAIDLVPDYNAALKQLNKLKVDGILTTGSWLTPISKNLKTLKQLKEKNLVKVIGMGGIKETNVKRVVPYVDEIHVGSHVRLKGWQSPIDIDKINRIKTVIGQ